MPHRAVAMPLLRCLRCWAPPHATSLAAPRVLLSTNARFFTSIIRKVSDTVVAKVTQLTEDAWLAEDKLVTEPRRKVEPQRALQQNLAERLASQRNVKQRLVPTSIKVDKNRQYVEFTWPIEAVETMMLLQSESNADGMSSSPLTPPPEITSNGTEQNAATPSLGQETRPEGDSSASPSSTSSSEKGSGGVTSASAAAAVTAPVWSAAAHNGPLRTRALAEYLRAYTPSTDGALGASDIVIYGRRGVSISQIVPMGNYALRFVFSDNHAGGIYSYEYLFYLTGPATKYGLMRAYVRDLRKRRKSRDPPKRAPSRRFAKEAQRAEKSGSNEAQPHP